MTKLTELQLDEHNANQGTDRGKQMLKDSLVEFRPARSIVLDKNNRIIAGNKTVQAAVEVGIEDVQIVESDGSKLIAVKRTDLDLEKDGKARRLAYADNRVGEIDLSFSPEQIAADLAAGVDLSGLWTDLELKELFADLPTGEAGDAEPQVDRAAELQQEWQTVTGQLWRVGDHMLLCGDSTKREDVERVMGGERADFTITDPPYNVGIDYQNAETDEKSGETYEAFTRGWFALAQEYSPRQIVTPGCNNLASWLRWFEAFYVAAWTKTNAMTHGFVSRFFCWEPIIFFGGKWFEGNEKLWKRQRANDVFAFSVSAQTMPSGESLTPLHPCPKPLELIADFLESYTDAAAIIYEPFLGSGTTMVACQNLGRRCRGIEISESYTAVCLQRMLDAFGIRGELAE